MAPRPPAAVVLAGASAGGIDALQRLLAGLPPALPVAVCVVVHVPAGSPSVLAQILARSTPLPVEVARTGKRLDAGSVLVAPPDRHLLLRGDRVHLSAGPRENGVRPAVDPLFRSAARDWGRRAIAVVLSGSMADGAAGATVIAAAGGRVLVQDPADASVPSMPLAALRAVPAATSLPAGGLGRGIAEALEAVAAGPAKEDTRAMTPASRDEDPMEAGRHPPGGAPSALTCPDCNGPLWELTEAGVTRYRCRIGHVFHEENLVAAKADEVETALWTAVETLDERADLLRRVADRMRRAGRPTGALVSAVEHAERQAEVIRGVLASGTAPEAA